MFSYWARPEHTHDLARMLNDHLAEVVQSNPRRFVALGTLPLQAPDLAIAELDRCVKKLGFPGVQIGTHVNDWNLNHSALLPIFRRAEQLGAAIFFLPWALPVRGALHDYCLSPHAVSPHVTR